MFARIAVATLLLSGLLYSQSMAAPGQPHARLIGQALTIPRLSSSLPAVTVKTPPIEDPDGRALAPFFSKLLQLKRSKTGRVRISHWGDSHAAPDVMSDKIRTLLQSEFGSGGPGFVLVGKPWRSYRHGAVKLRTKGRWFSERIWARYSRRRRRPRDDFFGIAGISVHSRWRASATIEPKRGKLGAIDVYYLRQPRGGRLDIRVGQKTVRRIFTVSSRVTPGYARVELPPRTRRVELRAAGGEVRIFGVDTARSDDGVVYDVFGINGYRADQILKWNELLMGHQLARLAPDLLVLAYGSNEIDVETLTRARFATLFGEVLKRMRRLRPRASCLVVGAPDQARYSKENGWMVPDKLGWIIAEQRRQARIHGCAFWDMQAAMGGRGIISSWVVVDPPMAQRDHIHLYGRAYRQLGEALHHALMQGFKAYQVRLAARPR